MRPATSMNTVPAPLTMMSEMSSRDNSGSSGPYPRTSLQMSSSSSSCSAIDITMFLIAMISLTMSRISSRADSPEDGSGTLAAGFIARESFSAPLRLPNTTALHTGGLLGPQLLDEGRQERTPRLFGFATAGQPLRDLQKHLGGAMIGGDFRDHLAIVGRRAEYLRVERNRRDRLVFNGLGEFAGVDFGPLRHADLVETI